MPLDTASSSKKTCDIEMISVILVDKVFVLNPRFRIGLTYWVQDTLWFNLYDARGVSACRWSESELGLFVKRGSLSYRSLGRNSG